MDDNKIADGEYSFRGRHLYINPLFLIDEGIDPDSVGLFLCPRTSFVCRSVEKDRGGFIKCRILKRENNG